MQEPLPVLWLTNSLSRRKEAFQPADPVHVTLYVCGPTVYDYAHIGNARPAVVFDVLARLLRSRHTRLTYVRNFTDVDDKINAAAAAAGVPIASVTDRFIEAYQADMDALGVRPPDHEPRVTDHIPGIIALIERLIGRGHAYVAEGHVLFDVSSYVAYGALSGRSRDEMIAGARVEVAPFKRDPADFVLWKPSSETQPGWASPWGRGRPGWHVECSAMIEDKLGVGIDIHGGGQDLIFPHHENEIAQGTCANDGALYCRYWLHNGFVTVDGRKMSKSLGNVRLVRDLLAKVPGEALRYALLTAHYRQPLEINDRVLLSAKRALDRLYRAVENEPVAAGSSSTLEDNPVAAALADDLNTPKALSSLFALTRSLQSERDPVRRQSIVATIRDGAALLGIMQHDPAVWFAHHEAANDDDDEIIGLVAARDLARATRDFETADRLRNELSARGISVEDRDGQSKWRRLA
ncbi:cysteine--tRNA ligase [Sphingorhabdus sp.]|uniref:cysteine--tRNA ligase n=1 Tax=Sphingorhabdus sp. TaxID=1902408 RepID=UPI003D818715